MYCVMITKARDIYRTRQSIHPVHTIFGAGYLPEHRGDDEQRKLPALEREWQFGDFVKSLRMLVGVEPTTKDR